MTEEEKDILIRSIISGLIHIRHNGHTYLIDSPDAKINYLAEIHYYEQYHSYISENILSDEEILQQMRRSGLWKDTHDRRMVSIIDDIENVKRSIFESRFHSAQLQANRNLLNRLKSDHRQLLERRYMYFDTTAECLASMDKDAFILQECSDRTITVHNLHDLLLIYRSKKYLSEDQIRNLARVPKWSNLFSLRESSTLFNKPLVDLSDNQVYLMSWSAMYNNALSNPDFPPKILDDNDMFDGWVLCEKSKRERENFTVANKKINSSQEVFIPVSSREDAVRINNLNDARGKRIKQQRFAAVRTHQNIEHQNMPDIKQDIMMAINNMMKPKG